jgi:hypothetical protein
VPQVTGGRINLTFRCKRGRTAGEERHAAEREYGCGWRSWDRKNVESQGNLSQLL